MSGVTRVSPGCYAAAMSRYRLVESATRIPVPGDKLIEELFGHVNTGTGGFSLAHMVAPPGWDEPAQTPEFGELTIMIRGAMRIEIEPSSAAATAGGSGSGEAVTVRAGQAFWVEPGVEIRYSNPFDEDNEYYAVCIPAFHPDRAHRAEE